MCGDVFDAVAACVCKSATHLAVHRELEGILGQRSQEERREAIVQNTGTTSKLPREDPRHAALRHPSLSLITAKVGRTVSHRWESARAGVRYDDQCHVVAVSDGRA